MQIKLILTKETNVYRTMVYFRHCDYIYIYVVNICVCIYVIYVHAYVCDNYVFNLHNNFYNNSDIYIDSAFL